MTFLGYRQAAFASNSPFEVPALLYSQAQTGSMATMERALEKDLVRIEDTVMIAYIEMKLR